MKEETFVTVELEGQLGNQLFQIATAYAYSLDHGVPLLIPNFFQEKRWNIAANATRLFVNRIQATPLSGIPYVWREHKLNYTPIPKMQRIQLFGYFQSEKYFKHRRQEILQLFSPPLDLKEKIIEKYPFLFSDLLIIGIQIRDYRHEFPTGNHHPTYSRNYYKKAMAYFPKEAIFIVSTNNPDYARECTEGLSNNLIYLNSGDYIEDFYVLTFCKGFIISNSSFGWWAAWLSTFPDKKVIVPTPWFAPPYKDKKICKDRFPNGWIKIRN